jgi:hypothetical protein
MKKLITAALAFIIFAAIVTSSCKKMEYDEIGDSISLQKNLIGNWKLDSIIQTDQNAVDKGFPAFVQKLNITSLFPYNTVAAAFTDNGNNGGTFTFTNPGNAPLFVSGNSGSYNFIDNGGPVRVRLTVGAKSDTLDFGKAYRTTDNKLALRYNRAFYTGTKKTFVVYDFNFSRN